MQLILTFTRFYFRRTSKNAAALRQAIADVAPKRKPRAKGAA